MNFEASQFNPQSSTPAISAAPPLLLLISAPSGGGKTTLCHKLLEARPGFVRAVTCTTRSPRAGERDGVDYHFLDPPAFAQRVAAGDFLEHATVYGHSYGTLKSDVLEHLRQGRDVLLSVDVQGAASFREQALQHLKLKQALVTVFLTPPSLAVLEKRLRSRGTDTEAVIQKRLAVARQEIARWHEFDYLLMSGAIPEDVRRMTLIIEAEKMRVTRSQGPAFA